MLKKVLEFIKKRYKLLLILLLIAGVSIFLLNRRKQQAQPIQVFEQPQYRDLKQTLEVSGVVDAERSAKMRFAAGGKIVYLGAKEGEIVKKWQTIATIDQRDLQKRLDQKLNLYSKERWDWEDQLDSVEDRWLDTAEQRSVDKNQWDLENTVLSVELQSIAITNTIMSAPFAGVLVYSPVDTPGVIVLATDYFELVDPESLIFIAEVDEEDIALVTMEQPVQITLDAYDNETIISNVKYIAYKSAQSSTGTVFLVEMPIATDATGLEKYRLGMNGEVEIILAQKSNVLTVPIIATKERDNQYFVDVKVGDDAEIAQVEERQIEVGLESEDYFEIVTGLTEQDEVLIPQVD